LIEKQLLGLSVGSCGRVKLKVDDGEQIHFTFPERARLAQNPFQSSNNGEDQDKIHTRRVQVARSKLLDIVGHVTLPAPLYAGLFPQLIVL
jgi:hypothetical protein